MLAQSQTCVQELTSELRNRCMELRELSLKTQNEEKLLQVRKRQLGSLEEMTNYNSTNNLVPIVHNLQRYIVALFHMFTS